MAMNPDQHRLEPDEHRAIFENQIKPAIFENAKQVEKPIAVVFGGQPGAGKTAAINEAIKELGGKGGAVEIFGDDLRSYHPKFERLMIEDDKTGAFYTDRDSGKWVEMCIEEAKKTKANIIIEGTMRNSISSNMARMRAILLVGVALAISSLMKTRISLLFIYYSRQSAISQHNAIKCRSVP